MTDQQHNYPPPQPTPQPDYSPKWWPMSRWGRKQALIGGPLIALGFLALAPVIAPIVEAFEGPSTDNIRARVVDCEAEHIDVQVVSKYSGDADVVVRYELRSSGVVVGSGLIFIDGVEEGESDVIREALFDDPPFSCSVKIERVSRT